MRCHAAAIVLLLATPTFAQQIATEADLAAILDDAQLIEDFEGISLAGGTGVSAPDPLNSTTAPSNWGLAPGLTYTSDGSLMLHTGFVHGDDSNILEGTDGLTVTFDSPQQAVGFDLVNPTGNVVRIATVRVYFDAVQIGSVVINLPAASNAFFGWQAQSLGISRVVVTSTASITSEFIAADNFEWGLVATPCPADVNGDTVVDFGDITTTLTNWGSNYLPGTGVGDANADGLVNFDDVTEILTNWLVVCP